MATRHVLIKISGDCIRQDVFGWIKVIAKTSYVVICVGGGAQINEAFKKRGFPVGKYGPLGRETTCPQEAQLAREVLEANKILVQNILAEEGISAVVEIPVLNIGGVTCHLNGDTYVLASYIGFDQIYVVTLASRLKKKAEEFMNYPKIKVVPFPDNNT